MKTTKIYEAYSRETNMTFILEDVYVTDQQMLLSTEVKGFYYGEPDDELTKLFYNNTKAEFEIL